MSLGQSARVLSSLAVVAALFVLVDHRVATIGGKDPYAEELELPFRRLARAKNPRHVVVGSSTSQWLAPAVRRAWRLPRDAVVDAHVRDCHPTCTLAEVKRLVRDGHHFETAFFGVNPYTYCESYRARRSMQHVRLMPVADLPTLFGVYLHSNEPLRHFGGFLLNVGTRTYGTTMRLQFHHRKVLFGNASLNRDWYRSSEPRKKRASHPFRCRYDETRRDFGLAATEAATRALAELAREVVVVLLPDRGLLGEDRAESRALFVREHEALISSVPRARLENLVTPGLTQPSRFRDGVHLSRRGVRHGTRLIVRRLANRGDRARKAASPAPP